jgi:hypothetical protein
LTITGFLGFAIAELYFGSQVLLAVAPSRAAVYGCIIGVSLVVYASLVSGKVLCEVYQVLCHV